MSLPATPYSAGAPMLTPAELQKFEAPLIAMANLSGGDLRKLFYAFFSFLNRRTDFYCILPGEDGSGNGAGGRRMGFREGQAEQILLASFRQFPLKKVGPRPTTKGAGGGKPAVASASAAAAKSPDRARSSAVKKEAPTEPTSETGEKPAGSPAVDAKPKDKIQSNAGNDGKEKAGEADGSLKSSAEKKKADARGDAIRYTDEGKQIPVGNGGSTSRYVWTQTLEEVTVHVPLPDGLRGKDLNVKIGANSLSVGLKGGSAASSDAALIPLEGTLFAKVRPSESTWTLETTADSSRKITTLQLILDKVQKTWWDTVLSGDTPLIDTTMVDSTRHIDTYDDRTQAEIRKIMFDQRQERLGLKTSQQLMMDDLPPLPNGNEVNVAGLPTGVEYIDGESLDKASIK